MIILLGGIILFMWNAVSWTTLPFHGNSLNTLPDTVIDQINTDLSAGAEGVYHYPGLPDKSTDVAGIENKLQNRPRVTLMVIKAPPSQLIDPGQYLTSFIINLMTSAMLFLILRTMAVSSRSRIFKSCVLIGLTIGIASDMAQMNWFLFSEGYSLLSLADHVVGFTLLGLLFGKMMPQKVYQDQPETAEP